MSASDPSVTGILAEALRLPAAARAAYLDAACADQPGVRAEIESLLAVNERAGRRMSEPLVRIGVDDGAAPSGAGVVAATPATGASPATAATDPAESLAPGMRLDRYVLEAELGAGGMGTVHRARQVEPVERTVAIKLVKPGMDTRSVLARFDLERRTLARLGHPNIATLLDAGRTPAGRPYVVMELVDGEPITRFACSRGLDHAVRIELLMDACAGVRHAHRRGVLHRDLKSSNVLVAEVDGRPLVKVIDFGIARLLEPEPGTGDDAMTLASGGRSPGTPRSMAPEQQEPGGVPDVRTDVYALGVLLVDLLATEPDARAVVTGLDSGAPPAATVDHDDPATALRRLPRGDLQWIARRCLESRPDDRYDGVDALAQDLERWRRGEPTLAGPPSMIRRLRVAWRRHRLPVTVAAVVTAALAIGLVVALDARAEARTDARRATVANAFLADLFDRLDPATARSRDTTLLREMLDDAADRVAGELGSEPAAEAVGRAVVGRGYAMIGEAAAAEPHLRRAIELEPRPDDRHELRTRLAGVLRDLGELDEAAAIAADVHRELLAERGPDDPRTLSAANNLAAVLMRQRRHAEAEPLLRAVLAAKQRAAEPDAASISLTRSNLATALSALKRDAEALPLREAILAEVETTLGPDHPHTVNAVSNLAVSLDRTGTDPARTLALRERALDLAVAVHGERHTTTLVVRHNLAMLLAAREQHAAAERLFREGLAIMLETLEPRHPFAIATRRGLAESLLGLGRAGDAVPIAEAAEEAAIAGLPREHPLQGLCVLAHADALHAAGRTAAAIAVLDAGTERLGTSAGADWNDEGARRRAAWRRSDGGQHGDRTHEP